MRTGSEDGRISDSKITTSPIDEQKTQGGLYSHGGRNVENQKKKIRNKNREVSGEGACTSLLFKSDGRTSLKKGIFGLDRK